MRNQILTLLKTLKKFSFIRMLNVFNSIDRINVILQKPKLTIDIAVKHLQDLIITIDEFREEGIDEALTKAKKKVEILKLKQEFSIIRSRKKNHCLEKLQKMRLLI